MRKVLSLLLCVAMVCSLMVFTVSADYDFAADLADVTIAAGGSGIVEINLTDNTGIAAFKIKVTDTDGLAVTDKTGTDPGVSFNFTNGSTLGNLTVNPSGVGFWSGSVNYEDTYMGDMIISIPAGTPAGDYTFTVELSGLADETGADANYDPEASFTVTVIDPEITEVNVMIDSGVNIGVFTNATIPLVALNTANNEYARFEAAAYEPTDDGYVCYINVNPWDMDKDYIIDFASNFTFVNDALNTEAITTAQRNSAIGILSYAEKVMGTDGDELDQLLADLLEFGRQAQIYNFGNDPTYDLPEGLTATELVGGADFAADCVENYHAERNAEQNATAKTKFKFASAKITFGSRFVVTFQVTRPSGSTAWNKAKVQVDDVWNSLEDDQTFTYAFSPAEYEGVEFYLWTNGTTKGSKNANLGWINTYGPVNYAAYIADSTDENAAALLNVLEAYCNYGASVAAYKG